MGFSELEQKRAEAGIDQKLLCARASVHEQTYSRLKNRPGPRGASETTIAQLASALETLIQEKDSADA